MSEPANPTQSATTPSESHGFTFVSDPASILQGQGVYSTILDVDPTFPNEYVTIAREQNGVFFQ